MRRKEHKFSQHEQEDASSVLTLKKKLAAAGLALAAGVGVLTGCGSSEEGSSGGSVIGNMLPASSDEVVYGVECLEQDDIYVLGTYSWDGVNTQDTPYSDLEAMKEVVGIPDGVGGLSLGRVGTLVDLDTLTNSQNEQLWGSYQSHINDADVYRADIQAGGVLLYGDKGRVDEYGGGEGYPESASDGVIDSNDLKVCVIGKSLMDYIDRDNLVSNKR